MHPTAPDIATTPPHPRVLGWFGTTALAMGGSNQMIFLITALFVGQGDILGQGSAAVPLLIVGVLLGWAAAPAWTELVLMWPNRVGGISGACAEAFRPYNPVLSALTGTCYWWGWVPTCGLTALLSASAIQQWYFPDLPVEAVAIAIVCFFTLRESLRDQMGGAARHPHRDRLGHARVPLGPRSDLRGRGRLAAGVRLSPDDAVRRLVRRSDLGDGRALSDRLRRAGLRGRGLPCRRDEGPQPQRAARHAGRSASWPASISSCCRSSGWACSARSRSARISPPCSARPSRRCSAASARRRPSGSSCSTCSTARCSRWPAPRARCRSWPTTGCCRASCRWRLAKTDCPWAATMLTAAAAIIFLLAWAIRSG